MTTMMEAVINSGTGYPVRARGFEPPAAGKTGTSHDAWFAGYTTNLLCIVWVGNDDYTDIKLAGGAAAAPIWAEFMKRAVKLPQYSDAKDFPAPSGVVHGPAGQSNQPPGNALVPRGLHRRLHRRHRAEGNLRPGLRRSSRILHQDLWPGFAAVAAPPPTTNGPVQSAASSTPTQASPPGDPQTAPQAQARKKKKGFFSRLFGKGDDGDEQQNSGTDAAENGNNSNPK